MDKLLVILGPTASGKTKLAVDLAYQFEGDIISSDSRQIYKGMDIGTGKDLEEYIKNKKTIPYHLIDILDTSVDYSVFQFKNDFYKAYNNIIKNNKIPILCGGTGLYIESVLLNYDMPTIGPSKTLREKLEKFSIESLISLLKEFDEEIYDNKFHTTKRRLIRSIEIIHPENQNTQNKLIDNVIKDVLVLGLKTERDILLQNIKKRLIERLENGMIDEVKSLIKNGMSLERLSYFGLEYKFIGQYLFDVLEYEEMVSKLNTAINRFSKKQMTFFRRMEKRGIKIHWLYPNAIKKSITLTSDYLI